MRVVWKDSHKPKEYKPIKYRGIYMFGSPYGWEIDIKTDDNLYKNNYCAKNAIDEYLGGPGASIDPKQQHHGIKIIGKKNAKIKGIAN